MTAMNQDELIELQQNELEALRGSSTFLVAALKSNHVVRRPGNGSCAPATVRAFVD